MAPENNHLHDQEEASSKKKKSKKQEKVNVADAQTSSTPKKEIKKAAKLKAAPKTGAAKPAKTAETTPPVAAVKPATVKKSPAKKAAVKAAPVTDTSGFIKITLQLTYHTSFGQKLYASGNTASLGNNDADSALLMEYLDNDNWIVTIEIDPQELKKHTVHYNYFLVPEDGNAIYDFGADKVLDASLTRYKEVYIHDAWNYAGYFENAFYTEPFQRVLLKTTEKLKPAKSVKTPTHFFKVKMPLLKKGKQYA